MHDPTERLIAAWVQWEAAPGSRPAVIEKLAVIAELGLDSNTTHRRIAAARRAGMAIPDAVQSVVLEERQAAT